MKLAPPENKKQRELCERAKAWLDDSRSDWDLPSQVIETNFGSARVWFIYEDAWPGDDSPNFSFSICIPGYAVWGRKKREKKLKEIRQDYEKRVAALDEKLKKYKSRRVVT